jgi:hypothetical protein
MLKPYVLCDSSTTDPFGVIIFPLLVIIFQVLKLFTTIPFLSRALSKLCVGKLFHPLIIIT